MEFKITEDKVNRMLENSLRKAISEYLVGGYGINATLRKMVDATIKRQEAVIAEAIEDAVARAVVSPGFLQTVEKEIATAMANVYRGSFDAVVKAAAKQAANNEVVARRVAELTRQAAGIPNDPGV